MATPAAPRRGARWTEEDEAYLRANVAGLSCAAMAGHLERTQWAVKCRLVKMAVAEHRGGAPLDAAAARYNVSAGDMVAEMEKNPTPPAPTPGPAARRGKRWTEEDEAYLRANVADMESLDMAAHLERTLWAVRDRLAKMAVAEHRTGSPLEVVALKYKVTAGDVVAMMQKDATPPDSPPPPPPAAPAAAPAAPIVLTPSQQRALDIIQQRRNACLTGPAGTGKSTLLKCVREWAAGAGLNIGVTAMTGCAALLVGGRTLHSFLGIGLGTGSVKELVASALCKSKVVGRLVALDILVVDEISMADPELLDKISAFLQRLRNCVRPFGGVQVLFIGDFFQLPPVARGDARGSATFAFAAKEWARADLAVVELTEIVRQQGDKEFADLLQRLRVGDVLPEDLLALRAAKDRAFPEGIRPTVLRALNRDVNRINEEALAELKAAGGQPLTLKTMYQGKNRERIAGWAKSCDIPEELEVAVGAQVVVTYNVDMDAGVVNGTRAVVVGYMGSPQSPAAIVLKLVNGATYEMARTKMMYPEAEGPPGEVSASYVAYYPIKLAYALSVHKCQGMTLDAVEVDLGRSIFEKGQAYTALSRARRLADVRVTDVHLSSLKAHPDVLAFYGAAAQGV